MLIRATSESEGARRGDANNFYQTNCAGPNLNMVGSMSNTRDLVSNSERKVIYQRYGGDRRYLNRYAPDACPSNRFWNENGYLRCVGN